MASAMLPHMASGLVGPRRRLASATPLAARAQAQRLGDGHAASKAVSVSVR